MKRMNGFLLVSNSPCPRFCSFLTPGMVSYMHFFQKRTMYQVTKSSLLLPSISSSKLVCRPVSQFLMSPPEDSFVKQFVLDSNSSPKVVFETYALLSLGSKINQLSFDRAITQFLFDRKGLSMKDKTIFLDKTFLNIKEKMISYLKGLDFPFKEEMLTAFTIGDLASTGISSKSLLEEVKHAFVLLNLNLEYGTDKLRFIMALGKIGILTPDYNKLDFELNKITILDGKEPSTLFILNNHDYLSKLRSSYGSDTQCALDTKVNSDHFVVRPDYFYFNSTSMIKVFLKQTVVSSELIPLANHVGWKDLNETFHQCGYDIKIKLIK